jgi:hypothetical protein
MSKEGENLTAIEAFTEVLESVTMSLYATDKKTDMRTVATEVLSVLNQFGWDLHSVSAPSKAIEFAEQCLTDSITAQSIDAGTSTAVALRGILAILIEQQKNSQDESGPEEPDDTPDSQLWGGQGAKG